MHRDNIALYAKEIIGQRYLKKLLNSAVTRECGNGILNFYVENYINILVCILNDCFCSY